MDGLIGRASCHLLSIWQKCNRKDRISVTFQRPTTTLPIPISQIKIVLSMEPEATHSPSGENEMEKTASVWSFERTCNDLTSPNIPDANGLVVKQLASSLEPWWW